jgi:hypothetical protein
MAASSTCLNAEGKREIVLLKTLKIMQHSYNTV